MAVSQDGRYPASAFPCLNSRFAKKMLQKTDSAASMTDSGTDAFCRSPPWPHEKSHMKKKIRQGNAHARLYNKRRAIDGRSRATIPQKGSRLSESSTRSELDFGNNCRRSRVRLLKLAHLWRKWKAERGL